MIEKNRGRIELALSIMMSYGMDEDATKMVLNLLLDSVMDEIKERMNKECSGKTNTSGHSMIQ